MLKLTKKRALSLLAAVAALLLLLPGCDKTPADTSDTSVAETPTTSATKADTGFQFTRQNLPRMNGSSSTKPMAEGVAMVLLGETKEQVQDLLSFSRTTQSYRELMEGNADLLLAA